MVAAFGGDGGDGFAEFGAALSLADEGADHGFEDDEVGAAVGFELGPGLTVAWGDEAEGGAEVEVAVLLGDFVVAVGGARWEGVFEDELAVDGEAGGAAAAEEEAVFSGGEADFSRGAEVCGDGAVGADAGGDVFLWPGGEAEGGGVVGFGGDGVVWPGIGVGDALFADLDEDGAGFDHVGGDWWWRWGVFEAGEERFGREGPAVDADVVEPAEEGLVGGAVEAGGDDEVVVVGDGWEVGVAAHVPGAGGFAAVDDGVERAFFAEGVGDGDVVPGVGVESPVAPPAVPVFGACVRVLAGEEEAELGAVGSGAAETESVVLVFVGRAVGGAFSGVAAFAEEVGHVAVADAVDFDPALDGDGFAGVEFQVGVAAVFEVVEDEGVGCAGELGGLVCCGEFGVRGGAWAGSGGAGEVEV